MSEAARLAAVAAVSVVCIVTVRRLTPEIGVVLAIAASALILFSAAKGASALLDGMEELAAEGGIQSGVITPVARTAGISLISRMAARLCTDAGESGVAAAVETAGVILALTALLPLVTAVMEAAERLL